MGKIVAIGGGEIGRPGTIIETEKIDREIIKLSGKIKPKVIFLPTASGDAVGYCEVFEKYYGEKLGCSVENLLLFDGKLSESEMRKKILGSDIVYVGGGNTLRMMKMWRKRGVDKILLEAYQKGIVMSGTSAGAICWFDSGHSDSRKSSNKKAKYIRVRGLGWYKLLICPHFDIEKERKSDLKKMLKKRGGVALGLENCCALFVSGDKSWIVKSKSNAKAYECYWSRQKYFCNEVDNLAL